MEILSDATFKGNVTFNKSVTIKDSEIITGSLIPTSGATIIGSFGVDDNFSFTPKGNSCSPILKIISYNNGVKSVSVGSDATFSGTTTFNKDVEINGGNLNISATNGGTAGIPFVNTTEINIFDTYGRIRLNNVPISNWSDLNNILNFAPASLSTTVNSNTTKINSACSTISSLCTTVSSLCTTVSDLAGLPKYCRKALDFDVPANCTKFLISGYPLIKQPEYMFMTKGGKDVYDTMSVVNVDLESRCDSTTGSTLGIIVTKSSGFEMKASDNYVLKYFY